MRSLLLVLITSSLRATDYWFSTENDYPQDDRRTYAFSTGIDGDSFGVAVGFAAYTDRSTERRIDVCSPLIAYNLKPLTFCVGVNVFANFGGELLQNTFHHVFRFRHYAFEYESEWVQPFASVRYANGLRIAEYASIACTAQVTGYTKAVDSMLSFELRLGRSDYLAIGMIASVNAFDTASPVFDNYRSDANGAGLLLAVKRNGVRLQFIQADVTSMSLSVRY